MPFMDALNGADISDALRAELVTLVNRKKASEELGEGAAVPCINRFIDAELGRLLAVADLMPEGRGSVRDLDALFYESRAQM